MTESGAKSSFSVDRVLRQVEVAAILGISTVTLWRMRQSNEFPQPIKLNKSGRIIGWRMSVVEQWIRDRDTPE